MLLVEMQVSKIVNEYNNKICLSYVIAVNLTSSVSRFGHVTVCRNETVLYECSVSGSNLIWRLSGIPSANHLYIKSDYINKVRFVGPSVMWLSNNQSLTSQLVLSYDPKLNNSTIKCFLNRTTYKSTTYITQGIIMIVYIIFI